jgi:hypothetical protein
MTSTVSVRAFVQARMSSRRFPGKVLAPYRGWPVIRHVMAAVTEAFGDRVPLTVLTSVEPSDDPLVAYLEHLGVDVFRGPLDDVFERFRQCLCGRPCAWMLRLNADTYDESDEIRPMLEHAVSRWHPTLVDDPDVFALVRRMVDANDEPVATATWLSHFVLCEAAAKAGVGTLFGGLGGDELNAGEYEYFFYHFADLARAGRCAEYDYEIERWVAHHDHPIYRKSAEVAAAVIARCTDPAHPGRCLPDEARLRRYAASLNPDFHQLNRFVPAMEAPFTSYLNAAHLSGPDTRNGPVLPARRGSRDAGVRDRQPGAVLRSPIGRVHVPRTRGVEDS